MDRNEVHPRSRGIWILVGAGALVLAVTLFRIPLATVFILGLVLLCPLLMVGMHGGGHGHRGGEDVHGDHSGNLEGRWR